MVWAQKFEVHMGKNSKLPRILLANRFLTVPDSPIRLECGLLAPAQVQVCRMWQDPTFGQLLLEELGVWADAFLRAKYQSLDNVVIVGVSPEATPLAAVLATRLLVSYESFTIHEQPIARVRNQQAALSGKRVVLVADVIENAAPVVQRIGECSRATPESIVLLSLLDLDIGPIKRSISQQGVGHESLVSFGSLLDFAAEFWRPDEVVEMRAWFTDPQDWTSKHEQQEDFGF